ncbi:uncharacterized protein LOC112198657 [Rosa chinensis]|uniref:uncharacterized protein LOC112198657 n=1 Tax=Rosa chinensis TaxID=74649 RepID=UPI000D087A74|nr:uncharacterized protein LOC112198657 [Rosa chinensis]
MDSEPFEREKNVTFLGMMYQLLPHQSEKASSSSSSSSFEGPHSTEGLSTTLSDQSQEWCPCGHAQSSVQLRAFVAGIIVGYTLKGRVKRWANKLLKRIKDD